MLWTGSTAIQTDRQRYLTAERAGLVEPIMRWANFHPSGTSFGIASYPKPATLLVALCGLLGRGLLGEATSNEAFHRFIDAWAYKHPYPSDLFNTFEAVSGRTLDWFWHSWFYEAWTLDHAVASVTARDDGSATVTIRDHGKAFMPARVTVTRADDSTAQRTVPVSTWLDGATEATLDLPAGPAIERIEIDAARVFPDIDRRNNVWTADVGATPTSEGYFRDTCRMSTSECQHRDTKSAICRPEGGFYAKTCGFTGTRNGGLREGFAFLTE